MISSLPIYLKMQMINKPKKYEGRADAGEPVGERIHKLLAQSGYGSRREIEKAILEDKVLVNNQNAKIGQLITPSDKIIFNGKAFFLNNNITLPRELIYPKPEGKLVTENDLVGGPIVLESYLE